MRIEAELDPIHAERLRTLQIRLNRPLEDVLGIAIDAALNRLDAEPQSAPSPLYAALDAIGFVGCIDGDEDLSVDYKSLIDFADDHGARG
jgi:hypothetical protein